MHHGPNGSPSHAVVGHPASGELHPSSGDVQDVLQTQSFNSSSLRASTGGNGGGGEGGGDGDGKSLIKL